MALKFKQLSPRTVVYRRGQVRDENGDPQETLVFMSLLFNYGKLDVLVPDPAYVAAAKKNEDLFLAELCKTEFIAVRAHMVQIPIFEGACLYEGCDKACKGHGYELVLGRVKAAILMHLDPDAVFIDADRTEIIFPSQECLGRCNA